jgi:hypothetical protein
MNIQSNFTQMKEICSVFTNLNETTGFRSYPAMLSQYSILNTQYYNK